MKHTIIAFGAVLGLAAPAWARVDVAIDLSAQRMVVQSSAGSYVWPISSGRSGFTTPRGAYAPVRLERMHYSRKYDNAPMPYAIFFRGGYAIHGTTEVSRLGRPASHGCVRLSTANAAALYAMVKAEGARISISGAPPFAAARAVAPRARAPYVDYQYEEGPPAAYPPSPYDASPFPYATPAPYWRYAPYGY